MKIFPGAAGLLLAWILSGVTGFTAAAQDSLSTAAKTDNLFYDAVKARMLGDDKQSEALLLQVIRQKPQDPAAYYELSRIAFRQNNAEKSTDYVRKAIALDGANKWYREQYANILVLRNMPLEAAKEFAQLARTEKYNDDYLLKSAMLYQRAGKYAEALAALDELGKKDASDEDILMQKQQVYLKMNDVAGAAGVIRQLIDRNPKEARYYSLLADIYENGKQPEKAAEIYRQMQEKFPNDPSLQLSLANQSLKKGDTAQYKAYVQKAITNKNLDAETQIGLLIPYLQEINSSEDQKKEALQLTEQVVAQHPEDPKVLSLYGDVLRLSNQPAQAAAQYKKVVKLNPGSFAGWQQLLYAYTAPADADSLIVYSEQAARLFPNQATVHFLNGIGYSNKKQYTNAIRAINRAIDLQPEESPENGELLADMYSTLGDIYNSMKLYPNSDSSFEHALRLNPKSPTVLNNYAYYLSVRNQRLGDAERMSKRSLELRPGEGTFLDTYGWILYQQGKYQDARKYIQQAVDAAHDEADATLWEHLGAVYYKLGDPAKAVDAWKKAKAKGADNPSLDKMIAERKLYE